LLWGYRLFLSGLRLVKRNQLLLPIQRPVHRSFWRRAVIADLLLAPNGG
jgi:hypothetical protein